ncbi:MAG: bifunctional (p)ppGpp synthetase/guanosine-3',5'-bis(diphosphate) 3'-pyrophosphohydrolase [Betaproteobacteria bacterium]|nr:MAG: bifunctional (p)ppGpp synthetase/guanosine-3',5'-bis(diphosphate) 3'-pyrophosphohydrolase [Betaproteobacteria bacterium]
MRQVDSLEVNFFAEVRRRFAPGAAVDIERATHFSRSAHEGQLRASGEPYFYHPLTVAQILLDMVAPDRDLICAALLHDVIEDCGVSAAQLERDFGAGVSAIVDGVTKFDQTRVISQAGAREETLRKLVRAGARDHRIFSLKCADRLHNLRTLDAVPDAKKRRVAAETLAIFCPLAQYVGLHRFAVEMENLAYVWAHPGRHAAISTWLTVKAEFDRRRMQSATADYPTVSRIALADADPSLSAEAFAHGLMLLREQSSSRALFATPVVYRRYASMALAYADIAVLHEFTYVLPGTFKVDLVAGVVSTSVFLGSHGPVVEFSFHCPPSRATPFVFEAGASSSSEDLSTVVAGRGDEGDLTRTLRELLRHRSITVLSPKGKAFLLPMSSTVLDFAFAVHSEIGLRARGAMVNGRVTDISSELRSGDVVEVITSERIRAEAGWIAHLRSPRGRNKLRHWLREVERADDPTALPSR